MLKEEFSKEAFEKATVLIKNKKVGSILFSEGTYQLKVIDKKVYWPFLQITDEGVLKDHFCTCLEAEQGEGCCHQAAAWLQIFRRHSLPLHVRFRESLWNKLCQIASHRHGYGLKEIQKKVSNHFEAYSFSKKKLFSIKSLTRKGQKALKEILIERSLETEETSLKFSNLTPEEISSWKEGKPSQILSYELSFWSDLAKWWMLLQDSGESYKINFIYDKDPLPKGIEVKFTDVQFFFYLAKANWPMIVPSLMTVNSPLKTHEWTSDHLQQIVYDSIGKIFQLKMKTKKPSEQPRQSYSIGEWKFIPKEGFYPEHTDPLLMSSEISTNQIEQFLQQYPCLIQKYLAGTSFHMEPVSVNYFLKFDQESHLHIICYIFEKEDLQKPQSEIFGSWVYLDPKGFYPLTHLIFPEKYKIIPHSEVSNFVTNYRQWLNGYPGFQTHTVSIESQLNFEITEDFLRFRSQFDVAEENEEIMIFDEWIYVKGHGFYPKASQRSGKIEGGFIISLEEISDFIQQYHDELENIPSFFAHQSPLQSSGLDLRLDENHKIVVSPNYTFLPAYLSKKVQIFGGYTYVEGEGFFPIISKFRFPDPYFTETVIETSHEPYFVSYEMDVLKPFIIHTDPQLQKPQYLFLKVHNLYQDSEGYWVFKLSYESDLGTIEIFKLWEALSENKKYLFSSAGLLILTSTRFNWLKSISKNRWIQQHQSLRLTTLEWMRLFAFEDLLEPQDSQSLALWDQFKEFKASIPLNIEGLQSHLRSYQYEGLHWLWFLYCHRLSGLLCDDMGLGKTHQAMALLAAAYNTDPGKKFLVVCPTSVIFHWEELLKKFLPKLKVYVYYGASRSLSDFEDEYDVLMTSYGILRSEKNILSKFTFDIAIFDEIQIAKNSSSQTHKALKQMHSQVRIGLTGTPIENNLFELHALFNIVLPGYMPTETVYKQLFVQPIEKQQDREKKHLLARLIKPFVLRRKKSEVLLELPEKTETLAYAILTQEQKLLYQQVYQAAKDQLVKELNDLSQPVPYLHVFALLTRLKQICDHPALYHKDEKEYSHYTSGKWDLFTELLSEARESQQKVVVFTQYLGMMDIIEHYLTKHHIGFGAIRGSTRNRKEQVLKFRQDPQCEVFIGSLQAAGVGIDLVSASVVIHYDRWWNPAKENQATDRVHRIGQNRGVQVFKMITRGTIEEHIHRLIERKLGLIEEVIGYDGHQQLKGLNREELLEMVYLMDTQSFKLHSN